MEGWISLTKAAAEPVKNTARVRGRGLLLSILEKEILLTRIKVLDNGSFVTETKDWDSYWKPLQEMKNRELDNHLYALHFAWRDYIRSGFNAVLRREFCFRYFSLLDAILSIHSDDNQSWLDALHTALGFECFGITSLASDSEVLSAGICTSRNPCYLLAKLKMPYALDDPQFLPIITVADAKKPELFYHSDNIP